MRNLASSELQAAQERVNENDNTVVMEEAKQRNDWIEAYCEELPSRNEDAPQENKESAAIVA